MEVENYVTACFTTGAFFCNAEGTSVVDGVEAQGTYDAGFVFGGVSYTYTRTTLPSQINGFGAFSYLPDHVLTLTGGLRFLQEKLTVGGRVYVVSEGYTGSDIIPPPLTGSNGPAFTDPYELLDFFSSYKVTDDWELGLTVTNVFDRAYSPALSTPGTDFIGETGRGRTFLLTTRAQF
jgi:hemoglobin/transferrin/lactoferrin receptor protein